MTGKGRGWHGEPGRHAAAARRYLSGVIESRRTKTKHTKHQKHTWNLAHMKMDRLLERVTEGEASTADYERGIEDVLALLEDNIGPEVLQLRTFGPKRTIEEELKLAREAYENSFSRRTPVDKFVALETARERLHGILWALP